MTLPTDLPGQIAHVFESSRQRDVLVTLASQVELLKAAMIESNKLTCELSAKLDKLTPKPVEATSFAKPKAKETKDDAK